jgi:hypothetical protein
MERRDFLKSSSAAAALLAAQGYLPLLAAPGKKRKRRRVKDIVGSPNCYTEPCAIEPISGYIARFEPVRIGAMNEAFAATYTLISHNGAGKMSRNAAKGSLTVRFADKECNTTESRTNKPATLVTSLIQCKGPFNMASDWTLQSFVRGEEDLSFTEKGSWDRKVMKVWSGSWKQERTTGNPLIARWALLPLLAAGKIKAKPLKFDMLDDSTIRANQTLAYAGVIDVPVKGGKVKLDSYLQTGESIVPTHYLVDSDGRVQLITMGTVNWALTELEEA